MRFLDRAFGFALAVFLLGGLIGAVAVISLPFLQQIGSELLQMRMISPIMAASRFGSIAVFLLIFANNSIPVLLSFIYPFIIRTVKWTPPMSRQRDFLFMSLYTVITAFLIGFSALGATLAIAWTMGGLRSVYYLLSSALVHGPLEFALVLISVAEPLRLALTSVRSDAGALSDLRSDLKLLRVCLLGLLLSAAIEVFAKL
jgi:hypothetical protein